MAISEDFLLKLRTSCDINEIMSPYVAMKRAGRDNVCLCPFHSEKTPSCHVYNDTQSFYCFGCGAGGDVITFIRLIENLDYVEAVKLLSERAGLIFPEDGKNDKSGQEKTLILEINKETARFYRDCLLSDKGKTAMGYLFNRGLNPNTIKKYGLGFAPDGWQTLNLHMRGKGYSDYDLVKASVLVQGEKNTYDKFRNRIMFPIIDRRGNVIGFGGRTIDPAGEPKYLNSSETAVFQKRNNLYSLNFAKNTKAKFFILCEGNLDVITLNQAGFDSAVATLGTAITPEQARLIRQYTEEVFIAYDSDNAGQNATIKAINLLSEAGISVRVLEMKNAKDPDEYVKKFGKEAFNELISGAGSALSFELLRIRKNLDLNTPEGRAEYLKKSVKFLSEVKSSIDRAIYVSDVAKLCEITPQAVEDAIMSEIKRRGKYSEINETRNIIRGGAASRADVPLYADEQSHIPEARAERGIIAYIFHSPNMLLHILENVNPDDFPTPFNSRLFETLILRIKNGILSDNSALGSEFSPQEMGRIEGIQREGLILPFTKERLDDYILTLQKHREQGLKNSGEITMDELREYKNKKFKELAKEK